LQKVITVSSVRLNYLEVEPASPSSKPPLLLLHQLLATAETLQGLIRELPADRRIVALDLLSAQPESGELNTRSQALAKLVAEFSYAVGLEKPVVIGHSYGGALGLWLAAMPEVGVQGLVLLCPAHPFAGYRDHVVAFYLTRWGRFLALRIPLAPSRMILWAYNQAAGTGRITLRHLKPHLRVLRNRKALIRVLDILRTWETDMTELRQSMVAKCVEQPVMLVWGDHDVVVPVDSSVELQKHLAVFEQFTIPGAGHLLPEEVPEKCGSLIRTWLIGAGRPRAKWLSHRS
jgi:pimeloyl-ACP methyl ester carboxylesterase